MKNWTKHIESRLKPLKVTGEEVIKINKVTKDSRKIEEGDVFVAIKGPVSDGHEFIVQAIEKGASVIVAEKETDIPGHVKQIVVEDSTKALGILASWYFDEPQKNLKITGVTGTNGKTTVATLLYKVFEESGYKAGLISTVEIKISDKSFPATNTTPGILELMEILSQMRDKDVEYVFMEVSSHGIEQKRIEGIKFSGGIFTNLTREHLDYHGDFITYRDVKKQFFDQLPTEAFALTNADDKNGLFMIQNTKAKKYTYALKNPADFKAEILEMSFEGMLMRINGKEFWTPMTGKFNAYNLLAVYGASVLLGLDEENVLVQLSKLKGARGRFERIISEDKKVAIIDYAHTPDALENVLKTIKEIKKPGQQIITVVGAGGDRDKGKRPLMAKVATSLSDWTIITSDNPRTEDPKQIIADIMAGVDPIDMYKTLIIEDRAQAIKAAEKYARPGDIILIAGKGHETYQIIGEKKMHFDDKEEIMKYLKI